MMLAAMASAVSISGCATKSTGDRDLLQFLDDDAVTRTEVRKHLGNPSATFEGGRIESYRLASDKTGYLRAPDRLGWEGVRYDLMLVFDAEDRLVRRELVTVREP
jgi:hypothetical protein